MEDSTLYVPDKFEELFLLTLNCDQHPPLREPDKLNHLVEKNAGADCDSGEDVDPLPLESQDGHLTGEIHPVLSPD